MHARSLVAAAAILALSCGPATARDLTLVARPPTQDATRQVFVRPFTEATAIAVQTESWEGGIDALRTQAKTPDNAWDLVMVDSDELATGCSEGLFEKLDWSAIGGKDHYLPQAVSDCGVGAGVASMVLVWDRDKFPAVPGWGEFWDVAKYPGKRGLRGGVRGNLEFALFADGVSPADVYKVLATSEGVDRAFRRLDQLKPYIVWWNDDAEAARILASGDVLMTSASASAIVLANRASRRNVGVQWAASLYEVQSWADPEGQSEPARRDAIPLFRRNAGDRGTPGRPVRRRRTGEGSQRRPARRTGAALADHTGEPERGGARGCRVLA